jgi:hypothetical protein
MNLVPSNLNLRLAEFVRNSIASDLFRIGAKVGFWRLVGLGILLFGLGAATGLGFYGYSYLSRNLDNRRLLTAALSKALADVRLKARADGVVQLEPRAINLAGGQTISLDSSSRILLDQGAKVRADGEITIEGPVISVSPTMMANPKPTLPPIVNFTVFKGIPFNKGTVQTGWIFLTSAQKSPTDQYCYYTEAADTPGRNVMLDIGENGNLEVPKPLPEGFDLAAAFSRCVWFQEDHP